MGESKDLLSTTIKKIKTMISTKMSMKLCFHLGSQVSS